MWMTHENWQAYNTVTIYHVCDKSLVVAAQLDSVCDHCHITGKYRGPQHLQPKHAAVPQNYDHPGLLSSTTTDDMTLIS